MPTYRMLLTQGQERLSAAGISEASVDGWLLLAHVTGMDRSVYYLKSEEEVPTQAVQQYEELLSRRCRRIPLQQITGEQEFMGLSFQVREGVLVPRQDTECLVERALPHVRGRRVLDMCTGSGCIAVSLAVLGKPAKCVAADVSEQALSVARLNIEKHQVDVECVQSDLYENVAGRFEVIVSNPPYIASNEIETLMPEVREHEPRLALDGGQDGLAFYRRLALETPVYLTEGGLFLCEIGCGQAEPVKRLLQDSGFTEVVSWKDYAGCDRVVCGRYITSLT